MEQLDFFSAYLTDIPVKDQTDMASVPMCHLGKRKRTDTIRWEFGEAPNKDWVEIASTDVGIVNIFDTDICLWLSSQIVEKMNRGDKNPSRTVEVYASDLLKGIRRKTGGQNYKDLEKSIARLSESVIRTSFRKPKGKEYARFHYLDASKYEERTDNKPPKVRLTLGGWIYDGLVKEKRILTIPKEYYDIKKGYVRFLYRVARKSVGSQPRGFKYSLKELHRRSVSTMSYHAFAHRIRKIIDEENIPEYTFEIISGKRQGKDPNEIVLMKPKKDTVLGGVEDPQLKERRLVNSSTEDVGD